MLKQFSLYSCWMMITGIVTNAQFSENFDDGNFINNPAWSGNTADFMVNSSVQLQSNDTIANSTRFLSTPNLLASAAQWQLYLDIAYNPSAANYIDAYVTASD